MPVSPVTPIVMTEGCQRRVLLLTSETALEAEVRDALGIRQHEGDSSVFFELTYLDPALLLVFLAVLDLLDLVRQGFFDMIHIVPSASTWSRARHSGLAGQHPLRSRSSPLGLSSLSLGRFREDPPRQQRIRDYCLGRRAGAPLSFKNGWAHSYSLKTWADTFQTAPRRSRAHVTLDVLLATCASSRERTTNVRLEFSPAVSIFETVCPWVGLLSNKSKTDLCSRAPSSSLLMRLFAFPSYWCVGRLSVSDYGGYWVWSWFLGPMCLRRYTGKEIRFP